MSKVLCLYTSTYPFGKGETFIENEIDILSQNFDEIYVFPHDSRGDQTRMLPKNAKVKTIHGNGLAPYQRFSTKNRLKKEGVAIFRRWIIEFFKTNKKRFYIKRARRWVVLLAKAFYDAELLQKEFLESNTYYHYSFWNNQWGLALARLKEENKITFFITRSGGFDIYDERHEGNYLPYRSYVYQYARNIYPNSRVGERYIKNLKIFPDKIKHAYWGTQDHGINPWFQSDTVHFVSVANMIPLKRLGLTIELLSGLGQKIHWTHFGSGVLDEELKYLAKEKENPNFSYEFIGSVRNSEIYEFYKTNSVDFFITTSSTEGLPVSVQEAISFGIPVIATDVGGMKEVVNKGHGILLSKDFDIRFAREQIRQLISSDITELRRNARVHWLNNFSADLQYTKFCEEIVKSS